MHKIFAAAAALALTAMPALAQHNEHEHGNGGGTPRAEGGGHPDRNPQHGTGGSVGGGAMHGPATNATPPAPQQNSNAMMMQGGNQHHDRSGNSGGGMRGPAVATPQVTPNSNMRQGSNRGGDNRSNNNRFDNNRSNNNFNNGMHGPNNNFGNRGNQRRLANFNQYQRNFTSAQRYRAPRYRRPPGWYSHRWTYGERLPTAFWGRDYWLDDFLSFGLMSPPYGTVWVRYGSDALLIDEDSGEVIQVAYGVFY